MTKFQHAMRRLPPIEGHVDDLVEGISEKQRIYTNRKGSFLALRDRSHQMLPLDFLFGADHRLVVSSFHRCGDLASYDKTIRCGATHRPSFPATSPDAHECAGDRKADLTVVTMCAAEIPNFSINSPGFPLCGMPRTANL